MKTAFLLLLWFACRVFNQAARAADRDDWHMEYRRSQHIFFADVLIWKCPDGNATQYAVFAPVAPELVEQRQVRSSFAINGHAFPAERIAELSSYHRLIFSADVPISDIVEGNNLTVKITYEATLMARYLKPGRNTSSPPVLPPLVRAAALSDSPGFGFKSPVFTAWLKENHLLRKPGETSITFGRRACKFLRDHMAIPSDYCATWDEPLDAACRRLNGDCGAHARLYTGILRANGIPARSLVGFWVDSKKGVCRDGNHVRTEFFADGVGWVPVDTEWPEEFAVGVDHGNFMVFHIYAEEPMVLPTPQWGPQNLGCMMAPSIYPFPNNGKNATWDGWHTAVVK